MKRFSLLYAAPVMALALAIPLALAPVSALAQEKSVAGKTDVPAELTKTQIDQIQQLMKALDARVQTGFTGEDKLKEAMTKDLKAIDALKEPKAKKAAISAYQKKYADDYRRILKKGGVDLTALSGALSRIIPGVDFKVINGTHLSAMSQTSTTPAPVAAPAPPPPPQARTVHLRDNDFDFVKNTGGCGAIAGSNVTFANQRMKNDVWSAAAGGCSNSATADAQFTVEAGTVAEARVDTDTTIEVFAVGVIGASASRMYTSVELRETGQRPLDRNWSSEWVSTWAAFLWASYADFEARDINMRLSLAAGKTFDFRTISNGLTMSGLSPLTNGSGVVKMNNPRIVVTPQ